MSLGIRALSYPVRSEGCRTDQRVGMGHGTCWGHSRGRILWQLSQARNKRALQRSESPVAQKVPKASVYAVKTSEKCLNLDELSGALVTAVVTQAAAQKPLVDSVCPGSAVPGPVWGSAGVGVWLLKGNVWLPAC